MIFLIGAQMTSHCSILFHQTCVARHYLEHNWCHFGWNQHHWRANEWHLCEGVHAKTSPYLIDLSSMLFFIQRNSSLCLLTVCNWQVDGRKRGRQAKDWCPLQISWWWWKFQLEICLWVRLPAGWATVPSFQKGNVVDYGKRLQVDHYIIP